ncbi:hypothetical protein Pmani_028389 [Petrolisthes manimaculis]|uniref:Uncharacterized protein n=1 Tax=Petrolisthes manimaculis TaxID=1843537 RepID=A0AAE1TY37_9EUCA|nr:hypothetical protein Pmani_028389 [Petrolisthes manimaculis]
MKPLSLEGLRRLVRSRDKQQPNPLQQSPPQQWQDLHPFWRTTNSFKRASIRRSARRYEKIQLPNGVAVRPSAVQRKCSVSSDERPDDGYSTDGDKGGGGGGGGGGSRVEGRVEPFGREARVEAFGGDGEGEAFGGVGVGEGWGFIGFGEDRVGGERGCEGDNRELHRGGEPGVMEGYWFPSTPSTGPSHQMITYDEWHASVSDEHFYKYKEDSLPSSLSTNKFSSRDSDARHLLDSKNIFSKKHSLDSKKMFSVECNKNRVSLNRHKTHGVDNDPSLIFQRGSPLLAPRMTDSSKTFRRSASAESPQPPLRMKSLLGSPRIAPKSSQPPNTPTRSLHNTPRIAPRIHERHNLPTRSLQSLLGSPRMAPKTQISPILPARSLHNTPIRSPNYQPMSAPSTPGKTHVHRISDTQPLIHQLRASWHEREMRSCNTNFLSGSPIPPKRIESKVLPMEDTKSKLNTKPQQQQSKWAAIFSGNFFSSFSPSKKKQQKQKQQQQQQLENEGHFSPAKLFSNSPSKKHVQQQQHDLEKQKKFSVAKLFANSPLKKSVHSLNKVQQQEECGSGSGDYRDRGGNDVNESPLLHRQQLVYSCESPTLIRHTESPSFIQHSGINSARCDVSCSPVMANYEVTTSTMAQINTTGVAYGMARAQGGPRIRRDLSPNIGACTRGDLSHHVGGSSATRNICILPGYGSPSAIPRHMRQEANSPLLVQRQHHPLGIESGALIRRRTSSTSSYDATLTSSSPRVVPRQHHQSLQSGHIYSGHQSTSSHDVTHTSHSHHQGLDSIRLTQHINNSSFQTVSQPSSSPKPLARHQVLESTPPTRRQFHSKDVSQTSSPLPIPRHSVLESGISSRHLINSNAIELTSLPVSNESGFSNHQNESQHMTHNPVNSQFPHHHNNMPQENVVYRHQNTTHDISHLIHQDSFHQDCKPPNGPLPPEPVAINQCSESLIHSLPSEHGNRIQWLKPEPLNGNRPLPKEPINFNRPLPPEPMNHQDVIQYGVHLSPAKKVLQESTPHGHHQEEEHLYEVPDMTHYISLQESTPNVISQQQTTTFLTQNSFKPVVQHHHQNFQPVNVGGQLTPPPPPPPPRFTHQNAINDPTLILGSPTMNQRGNHFVQSPLHRPRAISSPSKYSPRLKALDVLGETASVVNASQFYPGKLIGPGIGGGYGRNIEAAGGIGGIEDGYRRAVPIASLSGEKVLAYNRKDLLQDHHPYWNQKSHSSSTCYVEDTQENPPPPPLPSVPPPPLPSLPSTAPIVTGMGGVPPHTYTTSLGKVTSEYAGGEFKWPGRGTTGTTVGAGGALPRPSSCEWGPSSFPTSPPHHLQQDLPHYTGRAIAPPIPPHRSLTPPAFIYQSVHSNKSARPHTVRDLASPASTTSESSNRSRRKRGPGLVVGRASWLFRVSSTHRFGKIARRSKKQVGKNVTQQDCNVPHDDQQIAKKLMTHNKEQNIHQEQKQDYIVPRDNYQIDKKQMTHNKEQKHYPRSHHKICSRQNSEEKIDKLIYGSLPGPSHITPDEYPIYDPISEESTQGVNNMVQNSTNNVLEQCCQDNAFNYSQESSQDSQNSVQRFVSPQHHHRNMGCLNDKDFCTAEQKVEKVSGTRTAHANLLMPLNHPVGSSMVDGRSQRAALLVRSLLLEDEVELPEPPNAVRDTCSEPGGVKFTVLKNSKCETTQSSSESHQSDPGPVKYYNLPIEKERVWTKLEPDNTKLDLRIGSVLSSQLVKQPIETKTAEPDAAKINLKLKTDNNAMKTWNNQLSESRLRSNSGNTRLNLRIARNPELLLRALAALTKLGKSKSEDPQLPKATNETSDQEKTKNEVLELEKDDNNESKEQIENETPDDKPKEELAKEKTDHNISLCNGHSKRQSHITREESIESLISIRINQQESDRDNAIIRREPRTKIRRKRSHKMKRISTLMSPTDNVNGSWSEAPSSLTRCHRRVQRSVTCNESCYYSKVRQEAVKEALSHCQSPCNNLPLPYKRSYTKISPHTHSHYSDSVGSEDESVTPIESSSEGHLSRSQDSSPGGSRSRSSSSRSRVPLVLLFSTSPHTQEEVSWDDSITPTTPTTTTTTDESPSPQDHHPPPIPPHGNSQLRRCQEN